MNKPKLRFKAFKDNWQQNKMEDLLIKVGDGLHGTPKYVDNGTVSFINGNNIKSGFVITEKSKKVDEEQKSKADLSLNENTVLMSINGTIGNLAYYNHENIKLGKSVAYMNVNTKKSFKEFVFILLQTSKVLYSFDNSLTGTTIKNLGLGSIKKTIVKTPKSKEEQRQIGLFFNKIDNLIELKGNKIASLERLKRGYLQKLFADPYEDKPKLHFKEFKDDWKTHKLDKLIKWQRGKDLSKKELNVMDKGNKVVHYADLYKFGDVQDKVLHWSLSNQGVKLPDNSLLFPMSDVTPSGLARTTYLKVDNVKIGSDILIGTIKNECASFLSYEVNKNKNEILKKVTGTTVKHINSKALGSIKVSIPNYEEQSKIANLMTLIDKKINLQKQELDRLKSLKNGYLQKMFV